MSTPDGDPGLNYLCPSYKAFFHHIEPAMRRCATCCAGTARRGARAGLRSRGREAGRNEACTCGSGRKWKHCHGSTSRNVIVPWRRCCRRPVAVACR